MVSPLPVNFTPLNPYALKPYIYVHGWYEEERKAAVAFEALGAVGKLVV